MALSYEKTIKLFNLRNGIIRDFLDFEISKLRDFVSHRGSYSSSIGKWHVLQYRFDRETHLMVFWKLCDMSIKHHPIWFLNLSLKHCMSFLGSSWFVGWKLPLDHLSVGDKVWKNCGWCHTSSRIHSPCNWENIYLNYLSKLREP